MANISMSVTLSQPQTNGGTLSVTKRPQTIKNPRDERDVLHAVSRNIQKFAHEMESQAQKFKAKYGARPNTAFKATKPIIIKVTFDDVVVVDTEEYTSSAVMEYNLTLKKLSEEKGREMLMMSFDLTRMFATPIVFQRKNS